MYDLVRQVTLTLHYLHQRGIVLGPKALRKDSFLVAEDHKRVILASMEGAMQLSDRVENTHAHSLSLLSKSFSIVESGKLCLELVKDLTSEEVESLAPESLLHYGFMANSALNGQELEKAEEPANLSFSPSPKKANNRS